MSDTFSALVILVLRQSVALDCHINSAKSTNGLLLSCPESKSRSIFGWKKYQNHYKILIFRPPKQPSTLKRIPSSKQALQGRTCFPAL